MKMPALMSISQAGDDPAIFSTLTIRARSPQGRSPDGFHWHREPTTGNISRSGAVLGSALRGRTHLCATSGSAAGSLATFLLRFEKGKFLGRYAHLADDTLDFLR